jgi:hypothetical protein
MKKLSIETQGIKGGQTKTTYEIGAVFASFEGQKISIDNFEGRGDSYKKRQNPLIQIIEDGQNIFSGTFEELKNKLQN